MTLEIKTPALREALTLMRTAIQDLNDPDPNLQLVRTKAVVSQRIEGIVKTEIAARQGDIKIRAMEAKIIDAKPTPPAILENKSSESPPDTAH